MILDPIAHQADPRLMIHKGQIHRYSDLKNFFSSKQLHLSLSWSIFDKKLVFLCLSS